MARQPAKVVRSERLASRRREVRRQTSRRHRRVTLTFIAIAGLSVGGWMLARSSLFALEGIDVTGTKILTPADIVQASGLHPGQSMLSLHADLVRARLASLPLVRSVSVVRVPTSRIRIAIVERTPSFVLSTTEARWNLDGDGTVLEEITGPAPELPTIVMSSTFNTETGDRVRVPALQDAVQLWNALPASLRAGPVTLDATAPEDLLLVRAGSTIRFGTVDRLVQKLEAVRLVLDRVRRMGATLLTLDVRSPSRPAARLA